MWIVVVPLWGMYFTKQNEPISLLELRKDLLVGNFDSILSVRFSGEANQDKGNLVGYKKLTRCVFLRCANDFINKYDPKIRYGFLSIFRPFLDRLPSEFRRGLNYLFGRRDYLIHYVDEYSKSLKFKVYIAKFFFYFLIISSVIIFFLLVFLLMKLLKGALKR